MANKTVNRNQITIYSHFDDCKISHKSAKVVNKAIEWLQTEYESIFKDSLGAMKALRGKYHKYLGMALDYLHKGK
jgi:hypothetical protein